MSRTLLCLLLLMLSACGGDEPESAPSGVVPDPDGGSVVDPATDAGARAADNVLLIVWDTARADRMSVYGHDRPTTPFLEEFADTARVYQRAVSPGMWTVPSHASMFTGLPASEHGAGTLHKWLDHEWTTTAELLGAAGYATYAFSANPFVARSSNMLQGFSEVEHPWDAAWKARVEQHTKSKMHAKDRSIRTPVLDKDVGPIASEAFGRWLRKRDADAPFFAFVNLMEAHLPRLPSRESREAIMDPAEMRAAYKVDQNSNTNLKRMFGLKEYSEDDVTALSVTYDACLRDLDTITRDLVEVLRESGLLERTLVIVTSDHGENLGDHGLFGHKYSLHNSLVRVPLIVHQPDRFPPGHDERVVSTRSVHSTILEAAGLDPDPAGPPSLQLIDDDGQFVEPAFSELVFPTIKALERILPDESQWPRWLRTYQAVEMLDLRLIRDSEGACELFHMTQDPGETTDVAGDRPEDVERLTKLLDRWLASFETYDLESAGAGNAERGLSPEARAKLEALGYLED